MLRYLLIMINLVFLEVKVSRCPLGVCRSVMTQEPPAVKTFLTLKGMVYGYVKLINLFLYYKKQGILGRIDDRAL